MPTKALLNQAQEMQKNMRELQKNPGSLDTSKKLVDIEAAVKVEEGRQEQEEKREKEKLQAALKSSLTPKELADSWEAAAAATKNLNQSRNNIPVNRELTTILFLSARSDPVERVEREASREPNIKITQVEISPPLPKPEIASE